MAGLRVFPRNPIIGVGLNGYPRATQGVLGEHKGAHNAYMSILVELGLVGLILFLAILANTFLAARAAPLQERKLLLVLFFTLVIGLMPRAWETKKPTWVILALLHSATAPAAARARQVWAADSVRRAPLGRPYAAPRAV
jgi:O-antigen ligase